MPTERELAFWESKRRKRRKPNPKTGCWTAIVTALALIGIIALTVFLIFLFAPTD